MKQNFPLKYFYGDSVNAIKSQIWVTMIANILLAIVKRRERRKMELLQSGNQHTTNADVLH